MNDPAGRSELHYAALVGDLARVEELIRSGADPNVRDRQGFTPLHFAAQSYSPDVATRLIMAGADVDTPNEVGNTPLGVAVFNSQGRGNVIMLLLRARADPDRANNAGVSPRQLAERIVNHDLEKFFNVD